MVRRLVEQQEVRPSCERTRERGTRELSSGEGAEWAVEVVVGEAETPDRCGRAVAPRPPTRVLEARLNLGVAAKRDLVVGAFGHRLLEASKL
ncbi:MAG: hypothetical protein A2Y55_01735 [Actinobacteria bacterium RBG_16_68_12]|nr:MAG: hypothetical protein A2Y55_01735 [Actinobacteria bacterium RBG_16_68_12]